mmetsp:Transcript_17565/g.43814  ORF Transcript_17565/g.43814 Transcript_17565/m.43814 type:complete len:364 (-) Transcript_17565:179-1270(-)
MSRLFFVAAAAIIITKLDGITSSFGFFLVFIVINVDALRRASERRDRIWLFYALQLNVELGSEETHHLEGSLQDPLGGEFSKGSIELKARGQFRKGECLFESSPNACLVSAVHALEISFCIIVGIGCCAIRVSQTHQDGSFKEFRFEIDNQGFSGLFVAVVDRQYHALFAAGVAWLHIAFLSEFFFRLVAPVLLEALRPGKVGSGNPQGFGRVAESNRLNLHATPRCCPQGKGCLRPVLGRDRWQKARGARAGQRMLGEIRIDSAGIVAADFVAKIAHALVPPEIPAAAAGARDPVSGSVGVKGSHVHQACLLVSLFGLGHVGKQEGLAGIFAILSIHSRLLDGCGRDKFVSVGGGNSFQRCK